MDGSGRSNIATGVPFFDHMLTLFAKHAVVDLKLRCKGDVDVDAHHTVEDCGIALGQAFLQALGDKKGIRRYGSGIALFLRRNSTLPASGLPATVVSVTYLGEILDIACVTAWGEEVAARVPIAAGVPAITIGRGGEGDCRRAGADPGFGFHRHNYLHRSC